MTKIPSRPLPVLALMTLLLFVFATSAIAQSPTATGAARMSDDMGRNDDQKLRGDGSVDDPQRNGGAENGHRIVLEDTDLRTRNADGMRTRDRSKVTVNSSTGERRERTRSRVKLADGSEIETRTEVRTDADGNVLRERSRTRQKSARAESGDRSGHGRGERAERGNRAERAERPERAERAERPERADRAERADR